MYCRWSSDPIGIETVDQLQYAKLHPAGMEREDDVHDAKGVARKRGRNLTRAGYRPAFRTCVHR